jgi:prepilin-type N-terminal cleavage/methylation domain-containing protein
MRSAVNRARRSESGFTLIELLIVIVILGILAAIVVFSVSGITDRGKTSACKADVATVTVAGEAYYAQNGSYAANVGALVTAGFIHSDPGDVNYTVNAGPPASITVAAKTGTSPC